MDERKFRSKIKRSLEKASKDAILKMVENFSVHIKMNGVQYNVESIEFDVNVDVDKDRY